MTRAGVVRPDAIRRHNLGLLLSEVHRDGALTRAQLTQRLHLSRSSVGALVAELTERGLLAEQVPGSGGARAGRPSHVVGPRPDAPYVVAVDIDIDVVTTAAVGIGGRVLARHLVPLPPAPVPPADVTARVVEAMAVLGTLVPAGAAPIGIGVSVPGAVNRDGTVAFAPNLQWRDEAFGRMLVSRVPSGLSVSIGNDADLAILAEHVRGNARDCDDVIYLIGRVGVGAGIIVNGRPLRGHDGHAGEVGHNVVDAAGPACHCGKRGCVETYIGEQALLTLAGRDLAPTTGNVAALLDDAARGEPAAAAAVRTVASSLGRALASLVNVLNPERVLLGGSLAGILRLATEEIHAALEEFRMGHTGERLQLLPARLGDDSALLGAAELAFARLLADPVNCGQPATGSTPAACRSN